MDSPPQIDALEPADGRFSLRTLLLALVGVSAVLALCKWLGASASLSFVVVTIVVWSALQHRLPASAWLASYFAMSAIIGIAAVAALFGI